MNLDSQNKRILIITDIHQDIRKAEYILEKENYDICVNAGDEFDSFIYDTGADVEKTCNFIKKYIFKDNFYFIFGNHDLHYLYNNKYTICSGYEKRKDNLIKFHLNKQLPDIRNKFLHYLFVDEFLITHAGLNQNHLPTNLNINNKEELIKWLDREVYLTKLHLESGGTYWTYRAGQARGGSQKFGGWCWADWHEEIEPINGLNQICGHTTQRDYKVAVKIGENSINYCADTNLSQYIIINNGNVEIKNYGDL